VGGSQKNNNTAITHPERVMVHISGHFNIQYPSMTATVTAMSVSLTLVIIVGYHNYSAIMHNTGIVLSHISAGVDGSSKAVAFT